jgi:endonuclease/exonuclease/phosphatase family metal-dependent hydrolase
LFDSYSYIQYLHIHFHMKIALALGLGAATAAAAYTMLSNKKNNNNKLTIGGFNMQYGPYKISRIDKDTIGIYSDIKAKILTFNKYCMAKNTEKSPLTLEQSLFKIFGSKSVVDSNSYEIGLCQCLKWKQDTSTKLWAIDVAETFKTYFDPVKHELWTSALIDMTPKVAADMINNKVDIMALVETSNGIKNANGDIIPHTDNLVKLLENLNNQNNALYNYKIASYAQFTNPAADTMPQLNRGNAIIYNSVSVKLHNSFVIEISSEKRGKVTVRRYPVCIFGTSVEPTIMVVATHLSGYGFKDAQIGGDHQAITVGDRELENVLRILSQDFTVLKDPKEVTIAINGGTYQLDDFNYAKIMEDMKVTKTLPIIVIGDFNQDFNKYSIEYQHEYRFPTFVPHEGTTVADRYGFQNGYNVAKQIHPTTGYGTTIDGFLTKNITDVTLVSKEYDSKNVTSDHSIVYVRV